LTEAALVTACSGTPAPARRSARPVPGLVSVYLDDDVTEAQKAAIRAKLEAAPGAGEVTYVSHEEAYRRVKKLYSDNPDVQDVRPDDLPESFHVRLADRNDATRLLKEVRGLDGVDQATLAPTPSASPTAS